MSVVGHSPPPFFKRGPAPLARLFFFVSLSLALLVADDPLTCVVRGSGIALEKMDKLGSIFANE